MIGAESTGSLAPSEPDTLEIVGPGGVQVAEFLTSYGDLPVFPDPDGIYEDWQVEYDPDADYWRVIAPPSAAAGTYSLRTDATRDGGAASVSFILKVSSTAGQIEHGETTFLEDSGDGDRAQPAGGGFEPWDIRRPGDASGSGIRISDNAVSGGAEKGGHGWAFRARFDEGRGLLHCPWQGVRAGAVVGAGYYLRCFEAAGLLGPEEGVYAPFEVLERSECGGGPGGGGGALEWRLRSRASSLDPFTYTAWTPTSNLDDGDAPAAGIYATPTPDTFETATCLAAAGHEAAIECRLRFDEPVDITHWQIMAWRNYTASVGYNYLLEGESDPTGRADTVTGTATIPEQWNFWGTNGKETIGPGGNGIAQVIEFRWVAAVFGDNINGHAAPATPTVRLADVRLWSGATELTAAGD